MNNKKEFEFILQEREGFKIEFKESLDTRSIAKEIVAFANSEGGRIFIGVDDKGKIKGIEITNKLKSQIQDIARNCDPAVVIEIEVIDNVLVVNVNEGSNKPYKCSEGFFIRIGANSQKMSRNEIVEMIINLGNKRFDEISTNVYDYDKSLVSSYLKKAGISAPINNNLLFSLGVLNKNNNLNNAGILFFTKNPRQTLINAYITCARYKGIEKVNVIDRKDFEEDLVTQIEQAVDFVKRNTRLAYEIKELYRKEIPEYPIEAVREAILNSVMHRDYFEKGANVQIDIFDDRLTITNLGGLIKPLTKKKLGTLSIRRNPLIADLFHRIHFVEKMGTGIKRILEECKKHGNIKFKVETNGYFIATFKLLKISKNENQKSGQIGSQKSGQIGSMFLTKRQKEILDIIKNNSYISREELSNNLKINQSAIQKHLEKLKEKGLLKRIGPDKGGYWKIIQK